MKPLLIFFVVVFPLIGLVVFYLTFRMIRKNMQRVPSVALRQGRNNALVCLVGVVLVTIGIALAFRHFFALLLQLGTILHLPPLRQVDTGQAGRVTADQHGHASPCHFG